MFPRVFDTLTSKVEGENVCQAEYELTYWWLIVLVFLNYRKWGKPPEGDVWIDTLLIDKKLHANNNPRDLCAVKC